MEEELVPHRGSVVKMSCTLVILAMNWLVQVDDSARTLDPSVEVFLSAEDYVSV